MIITTDKPLRSRDRYDHYPTPASHVAASLALLPADLSPCWILDPGAGNGVWGQAARQRWPLATITGIELRDVPHPPAYSDWWPGAEYLTDPDLNPGSRLAFDLVIGNPPYSLAEPFIRRSLEWLWNGGYLVFLLRLAFLEGQARHAGLWRDYPPLTVGVFGDRPSFTNDSRTDATAYCAMIWRKGWHGDPTLRFIRGVPV